MATHVTKNTNQYLLVDNENFEKIDLSLQDIKKNTNKIVPTIVDHKYLLIGETTTSRVDENESCIIQSFTFRTSSRDSPMLLRLTHSATYGANKYQQILSKDEVTNKFGFSDITPKGLFDIGGENSLFKIVKYEITEGSLGDFVIMLKRPLHAPWGFTMQTGGAGSIIETSILLLDGGII